MQTPLDRAHAALAAAGDDPSAWPRFLERVLDAELFLLLEAELVDDVLRPEVARLEAGGFALAFDRDERLAAFLDAPAAYAALPGRRLVALLADAGLGLALNLGVAASETLVEPATLRWLAGMTADRPTEVAEVPREVGPPRLTRALVVALEPKLVAMRGMVAAAHLVEARFAAGPRPLLVLVGVPPPARGDVAAAVAEAVRFARDDTAGLDVAFLDPGAPMLAAVERVSVRFDLPPQDHTPAPRRDPAAPPRLR